MRTTMRTGHLLLTTLFTTLAATACGSGGDDATGGGGTSAGGASTTSSTGGTGGAATTTSSAGGMLPVHPGALADDGLIARYYLDEAAMGQGPAMALDAAPDPLDLTLTYANDMDGEHMVYFEDAVGNRGLSFDLLEGDDRASAGIDATKVQQRLQASQTVTFELVADIRAVSTASSRLIHIGLDQDHTLSFEAASIYRMDLSVNDRDTGRASVDFRGMGRAVYHVVVDTSQPAPEDRARFYVNGGRYPNIQNLYPNQDELLDLGIGRSFVLGNREVGERTFEGVMYYAAIYDSALTPEQVAQNAAWLLVDDDTPATP